MNLSENVIHIWRTKLNAPAAEIKNYEKILSDEELEKASRFRFEKDKICYIACRGILRNILSDYLSVSRPDLKLSYTEKGKPFLKDNKLKFNLAHSNGYAVYAFTLYNEIGIDIEYIREIPDALQIAKRFFSQSEREELIKIQNDKLKCAFLNCWTRKEAFIKAIGDGLSYPLENFSVSLKPEDEAKVVWIKDNFEEIKLWTFYKVSVGDNYISSLAIKANNKKIVYKDFL